MNDEGGDVLVTVSRGAFFCVACPKCQNAACRTAIGLLVCVVVRGMGARLDGGGGFYSARRAPELRLAVWR